MNVEHPKEEIPSIGISYQIQTRQSRQLVLQSFVPRDCTPEELDALLDKMRNAGERQLSWEKIDDLTLQLKQEHINIEQNQIKIEREDEIIKKEWDHGNRRGEVKLTQHQIQKQREALANQELVKERIAQIKSALADHRAKVGLPEQHDAA